MNAILVTPDKSPQKRLAYSPAEFAAACGRHTSWAYRLLYKGKLNALTTTGRLLIPAGEIERLMDTAAPYDPKPKRAALRSKSVGAGAAP